MLSKVIQIARFWPSFSKDKMWTFSKDRVPGLYAMVLRSVATSSSVVSQLIRTQHKDVSVVCRTQIRVASAALSPGHKIFILAQRQRRLEVATHLTPATTCKYTEGLHSSPTVSRGPHESTSQSTTVTRR